MKSPRKGDGRTVTAGSRIDRAIEQRDYYQTVCGLAGCYVRGDATAEIYLRVGATAAVVMPSELGRRVCDRLPQAGPVIVEIDRHRRGWWTMLTGPVEHHLSDFATFVMLSAVQARLVPDCHEVALPTPGSTVRRWLGSAPTDAFRPPPYAVVDAIRAYRFQG